MIDLIVLLAIRVTDEIWRSLVGNGLSRERSLTSSPNLFQEMDFLIEKLSDHTENFSLLNRSCSHQLLFTCSTFPRNVTRSARRSLR